MIDNGAESAHFCGAACRFLRERGIRVSAVSPDPAAVTTDPGFADAAYIEPVAPAFVERIIAGEWDRGHPVDHLLPGRGADGCAAALAERGVLKRYDVAVLEPEALDIPLWTEWSLADRAESRAVVIVGAGGHGVDYEHSCAHAAAGFRKAGFHAIIVDSGVDVLSPELDHRYLERLRPEELLEVCAAEEELAGVVLQLGGPAAWSLAEDLADAGVPLLGGAAELLVPARSGAGHIAVDALTDGDEVYLGGIIEQLGEAEDAPGALQPNAVDGPDFASILDLTGAIARDAGTRGLLTVRYDATGDDLHVVEAAARGSGTVPFVSKATGVPLAEAAALLLAGKSISELRAEGVLPAGDSPPVPGVAVRDAGMGLDRSLGRALAKACEGGLPTGGRVYVSAGCRDRRELLFPVKRLGELGFEILAGADCAAMFDRHAVPCVHVAEEDLAGEIADGKLDLLIATGSGADGLAAEATGIPCALGLRHAEATVHAIEALIRDDFPVFQRP
ncbi:hypothetical protein ACFQ05_32730 [Amycolatopsis umgeniensis]|uniref:MGS-like domain-containing protein n=1 Tax=Amycolatopsis umgeniensis TaxID=336628 RepID=A0A841AV82_9PSEU|nr:hypothetical protein [Amycolatopsis umgeniensis]MBB5850551.1 hypothetical protein [Amycolatopsis umgeniensis]